MQLNSARIRASQLPTRVSVPGRAVRVTRVALVAWRGQTAFVVQVHNPARRPMSDLPISVGVRVGAAPATYLNAQSQLAYSYFDAHLPVVAAHGTITWVYTTGRRLPPRGRPFAIVGDQPSPPAATAGQLPVIRASARPGTRSTAPTGRATGGGSGLVIALHNLSGVPQYQLQVYAFAQTGRRYVAAGRLTVPVLGSEATRTLQLGLLGNLDHARLQIEAIPTIFQ